MTRSMAWTSASSTHRAKINKGGDKAAAGRAKNVILVAEMRAPGNRILPLSTSEVSVSVAKKMRLSLIVPSVVAAAANLAAAVLILFVLLLALNGYSESDAFYGLAAFATLALAALIFSVFAAVVAARLLFRRGWGSWAGGAVASLCGVLLGCLTQLAGAVIAVALAEVARNYF